RRSHHRHRPARPRRRAQLWGASLMSFVQTLNQVGVAAFGWTLPTLAPSWTSGPLPTVHDAALQLTLGSGTWSAPIPGIVRVLTASEVGETLVGATGTPAQGPGILLTLLPPVYLRLARLYAMLLEDSVGARPERALGLPIRPITKYFLFRGTPTGDPVNGHVVAGDPLALTAGDLTIYSADGLILDPLAVAS